MSKVDVTNEKVLEFIEKLTNKIVGESDIDTAIVFLKALLKDRNRLSKQLEIVTKSRDYQRDRAIKAKSSRKAMAEGLDHFKKLIERTA